MTWGRLRFEASGAFRRPIRVKAVSTRVCSRIHESLLHSQLVLDSHNLHKQNEL